MGTLQSLRDHKPRFARHKLIYGTLWGEYEYADCWVGYRGQGLSETAPTSETRRWCPLRPSGSQSSPWITPVQLICALGILPGIMLMAIGSSDVFAPLFAGAPTLWDSLTNNHAGLKLGIMWLCTGIFVLGIYSVTQPLRTILKKLDELEPFLNRPSEDPATKRDPEPQCGHVLVAYGEASRTH